MACEPCKGYRWFDDRGYPAMGQVAFSFHPCSTCNPKGELEMWGGEIGDPTYKPDKDHRLKAVLKGAEQGSPAPHEPSSESPKEPSPASPLTVDS